jgi:hypothetical protein
MLDRRSFLIGTGALLAGAGCSEIAPRGEEDLAVDSSPPPDTGPPPDSTSPPDSRPPPDAASVAKAPFVVFGTSNYGNRDKPPAGASVIPGTFDSPLSGAYGKPHMLDQAKREMSHDNQILLPYKKRTGKDYPPWGGPDPAAIAADIVQGAVTSTSWNGLYMINGEGDHWNEGDNAWNHVNESSKNVELAAKYCASLVKAIKAALPKALVFWYEKPTGSFSRTTSYTKAIAARQDELLQELHGFGPSMYFTFKVYEDSDMRGRFLKALNTWRDKLAWIRDTYPDKLIVPTLWDDWFVVGGMYKRAPDQACPFDVASNQYRRMAKVATWNGKTLEPCCTQPSMPYDWWLETLDMIYDVGCDGVWYWCAGSNFGKYWWGQDDARSEHKNDSRSGIRGLIDWASALGGKTPNHDKPATFKNRPDGRGPF